jgi:hypothetical protein
MTIKEIVADESIPREMIRQLDTLQDIDDTPLAKWFREMFEIGERLGLQRNEILAVVKTRAKNNGYSDRIIRRVLRRDGWIR